MIRFLFLQDGRKRIFWRCWNSTPEWKPGHWRIPPKPGF